MADANHRNTGGCARPHVHALPSHRMVRRARPLPEKLTFFHLFWIFVICSVIGLVVETIVSYPIDGIWKDRAGLVWGPFSPIYGVGGMLMVQTLINVGMCAGIMPVIGLTLPFFSYGGSSLLALYAAMGIVSGIKKRAFTE